MKVMNRVKRAPVAVRAAMPAMGIRLWVTVLAAAGLAVAGAVVPGTAALASTACWQNSCAGHDPGGPDGTWTNGTYSCPTTWSNTTYISNVAVLINHYSSYCDSNWVSGQLTTAGLNAGDSIELNISANGDHPPSGNYDVDQWMCYPGLSNTGGWNECPSRFTFYGGSAEAWTDMVNGHWYTYGWLWLQTSNGMAGPFEADG